MNIHEHFKLIIDKYNLSDLYKRFLIWSILNTVAIEGFYWSLLYFTEALKTKSDMIKRYTIILVIILALQPFIDRMSREYKRNFIKEFRLANSDFYNNKIANLDKTQVLNFNIVEYSSMIESFNNNYQEYINNILYKYDIPIKTVTLGVISYNKKFYMLLGLAIIFFLIIRYLFEQKLKDQKRLVEPYLKQKNLVVEYIINSKNFIVNNEFNNNYVNKVISDKERVSEDAVILTDDVNFKINLLNFGIILFVIIYKLKELTPIDFLQYFLIIYDIQDISNRFQSYYETKSSYPLMEYRLEKLNGIPTQKLLSRGLPDKIVINKIENKTPLMRLNKTLVINRNDHILIQGVSGSGKTSFLQVLKGMIKPEIIQINPSIENIIPNTYITLSNHKELFNAKLHDIITNYQLEPNVELINESLVKAQIDYRLTENKFVNVEELSTGERMRLLIARIIYNVKSNNYSVLLFDELDENLNDELSVSIIKNIKEIFNDRTILYISHNNEVKKLFKKKITIKNGEILFNF